MKTCPNCACECPDDAQYCINCGESLQQGPTAPMGVGATIRDAEGNVKGGAKITQVGNGGTIVIGGGNQPASYDHCIKCGKPIQAHESYRCPVCAQKPLCRNCFNVEERMCLSCISERNKGAGPTKEPPILRGTYRIIARHSGKALDVENGGERSGTNVQQWSFHKYSNQQWRLEPTGDGYYYIIAKHSGKALDVQGYSQEDGANVFQWRLHKGTNQQWELVPVDGEYYHIIARHSGKALDVQGYSPEDGANVFQWRLHGGTNQQWKLEPILYSEKEGDDDSNSAEQLLAKGKSLVKKHKYNEAINELTKAIELDPQLAEAYRQRGIAYRWSKRPGSAVVDYTAAIKLQPNWAEAYRNRGNAFRMNGDYEKAIADFNKAIKLKPDRAEIYYNRGKAFYLQHDKKRAIADMEQCLKINPNHNKARSLLSNIKTKGKGKKS